MTRYEYLVEATTRRNKVRVAHMTCYGDNKADAISHATQWWKHMDEADYAAYCKITARRTGKSEHVWRPKER